MPIFDYRCPNGHTRERLVSFEQRDVPVACHCGATLERQPHTPHCLPDGMYSYAPNQGSEAAFSRRLDAIKNGERIIKKEA